MLIHESTHVPDHTYFRTGEVEPTINPAGAITIYDGEGTRRSWGKPGVTSTVILNDHDFTVIHVGFHHKHGGGQFWRYYTVTERGTEQVSWASLSDELRQRILDARRPAWAKAPGKLRSAYRRPALNSRQTYKIVALHGERMISLYDSDTEYRIGKRLVEKAQDGHNGGYYSYASVEGVKALWYAGDLVPDRCYRAAQALAVLECEISGTIIEYPNGKLASSYLKPVRIVETFQHTGLS